MRVEGLNEWVVRSISGTLYLLFGGVALLLAIGCGNVSILLLARGMPLAPGTQLGPYEMSDAAGSGQNGGSAG